MGIATVIPKPPDQFTPVDSEPFRRWFYEHTHDIPSTTTVVDSGSGITPYFIASGQTFTVPIYKQSLFAMTIDNEGVLIVDGFLILVD